MSLRWLQGYISMAITMRYHLKSVKKWLKFDTKRSAQLRFLFAGTSTRQKCLEHAKCQNRDFLAILVFKRRLSGLQNLHSFAEECRYKTNFKWLKKALCFSDRPVTTGNHRNVYIGRKRAKYAWQSAIETTCWPVVDPFLLNVNGDLFWMKWHGWRIFRVKYD